MDKNDFFIATKANWKFKKNMTTKAILKFKESADFVSDSLSMYKYTRQGVYRVSNHFNDHVASCNWLLDGKEHSFTMVMAYCSWKDFERIISKCCGYEGYWYKHEFYPLNGKKEEFEKCFLKSMGL